MRNPLTKRLPRELRTGLGKYAVIFIAITGMIAFVSGFLVASNSMVTAYHDSFETYRIEDGNIEFSEIPDEETLNALADGKLDFYENFYKEEPTAEVDSTLRIFRKRTQVDLECLMSGAFPASADEIAIDRLYAENNGLSVGDTLTVARQKLTVSGFVALTDYSALFSSAADMMFDAKRFGVAIMTDEGYDAIRDTHLHFSYAWVWCDKPADDRAAKKLSDGFLEHVADTLKAKAEADAEAAVRAAMERGEDPAAVRMPDFLTVENYIPAFSNQAIIFAGDDMSGDAMMFTIFLYILVAIIAFIMAVTASNTITAEANVIGTLRATGYSRAALTRHYMIMPVAVTLVAAIIGNVLGYTLLKEHMAAMYYNSYCLTTYKTLWNADALIETTVIPVILMVLINFLVIRSKMRLSPLKFMRGELSTSRRRKAFRLNTKIPIMHRFRLRVLFQNLPNYLVLAFGIFLANFVLLFGVMFEPMLANIRDTIVDNMIADYQYMLKTPEEAEEESAEKFQFCTLQTPEGRLPAEGVSVFGFPQDSRYCPAKPDGSAVVISNCYAEKHRVSVGDTVTLEEQYSDGSYQFRVSDVVYYPAGLAVFMTDTQFCEVFDREPDYYTGYFSDKPLSSLDEDNVAACITASDMTKVSDQLMRSMGSIAQGFQVFAVIMFLLLMYLLAKIIIERNSQAISMTKILGYSNREISSLYSTATTVVVLVSVVGTVFLCNSLMEYVLHVAMSRYPGWYEYIADYRQLGLMIVLGLCSYLIISALLMLKIRRIPMSDALKHQE